MDFEKAFDLLASGVRKFWKYEGFKCHVVHEGKLIDALEETAGVRQGCILSPTLFLFLLDNVVNKSCKTQKERNTVDNDGKVRRSRFCQ